MDYTDKRARGYVSLVVRKGLNIQPGQQLVISAGVEDAPFVRLAMEEAYKAGSGDVHVRWHDDGCSRVRYLNAPDDVFDTYPEWTALMMNSLSEKGAAYMAIVSDDPETLKGVDPDKIIRSVSASQTALKPFRKRTMESNIQWCVMSVPGKAWAKKVFPNEADPAAKLWANILEASRADNDDPAGAWDKHIATFKRRLEILNNYQFKALKYKNSLGTDFTIDLAPNHIWLGGDEETTGGVRFLANIPTEEVFTAPARDGANGTIVSTKPLVYQGNLITDFKLTFKDGKVISYSAKEGEELLGKLFSEIKDADRLGEVALVPFDSPISNSNILYYETLFDENASCHLAFGNAYPTCVAGGVGKSEEEQEALGLNVSKAHEDFMIGSGDLSIVGVTKDGGEIDVFVNGNFAF